MAQEDMTTKEALYVVLVVVLGMNRMKERKLNMKQGWIWESDKYGVWFLPRQAVIDDWKQDHKSAYSEDKEPTEDEVQTWFNEQTSWYEVAKYGVQVVEPNMEYWKKLFNEQMKRDTDWAECIKEVE